MASTGAEGEACVLGRWRFAPDRATLSDGATVRRLEARAAATLAVLCRRRGEVVSRQELLDEVWRGRAVSANSVAIVIADLRRALGDDARAPLLLKTVNKRGYLLAEPEPAAPAVAASALSPSARLGGAAIVAALLLAAAALLVPRSATPTTRLVVAPVVNDTGSAAYTPLTAALDGLVVHQLAANGRIAVERAQDPPAPGSRTAPLRLSSRLALWNGSPTLYLQLDTGRTGRVLWSGMAVAPADRMAAATIARLAELGARIDGASAGSQRRR